MRLHIIMLLMLVFATTLFSQTRRMNNAEKGRTYTVENQTRTVQPLLQKAERQFRSSDYDGTFLTLENAVAQNPFSTEALLMRARFRKMVGMQSEAEADLRLANRINPLAANLYGYYGNSGLLKILSIEPKEAITGLSTFQKLNYYYQDLDRKIIANEQQEEELLKLQKVVEEIESNRLIQALILIDEILEQFPESAVAYDLKGVTLKKQGKFEQAVDAFSEAVKLEPNFAIAWYNVAQIERSLGHFEKAKAHLDRAIELQEDLTKAYFERAMLLKQMGDKESALDDYNSIIEMKGSAYMEAFLNRGLTKKMLGDYGGALADLNQVIDEFPNNAELHKNRGNLNLLFGLHRKAIDDYTRAIELDNNYAEAYYNRALAFFLIYDKVSGCFDLDKSLDLGYEKAMKGQVYFCTE